MPRHLSGRFFRAPWPFVKKGPTGIRKIGPMIFEKHKWPGQDREFPELSPKIKEPLKNQHLNPKALWGYTGVHPIGYDDPQSGEFVKVQEMVPELVVPDLAGFELGPYVSYRTDVEIKRRTNKYEAALRKHGSEEEADKHTSASDRWPPPKPDAKTLFDIHYADKVKEAYLQQKKEAESDEKKRKS